MNDLNSVQLTGRLTRDPDSYRTQEGKSVARFTLAVNSYQKEKADFINCCAFGKTADVITQYLSKGRRVCVTGSLRTGQYTNKQGATVHTTDIFVNNVVFIDSKNDQATQAQTQTSFYDQQTSNDFYTSHQDTMNSYKSAYDVNVDDSDIDF